MPRKSRQIITASDSNVSVLGVGRPTLDEKGRKQIVRVVEKIIKKDAKTFPSPQGKRAKKR